MVSWEEVYTCILDLFRQDKLPVTIIAVIVYSLFCEVYPQFVTSLNSNAYTSQVFWNVTLRGLRFQLVNYYIYHTKFFAIAVHAVTLLMDTILWTTYLHHLLRHNLWWAFLFQLYMCSLQALAFDSVALKTALIASEAVLVGLAGLFYQHFLSHYPDLFAYTGILLILNALARVISHMPEPLPMDYLGLNNTLPIKGWYWDKNVLQYLMYPPRITTAVVIGVFSELQAGLPLRLLTSVLVLLLTRLGWSASKLSMQDIRDRADKIDIKGWAGDKDGKKAFLSPKERVNTKEDAWGSDHEVQKMFVWAAKHRFKRRVEAGEVVETWLPECEQLPCHTKKGQETKKKANQKKKENQTNTSNAAATTNTTYTPTTTNTTNTNNTNNTNNNPNDNGDGNKGDDKPKKEQS